MPSVGESDSKLYTNFDFCKKKLWTFKKPSGLKSQAIYDDKNNSKKSLHF